MQLCVVSVWVGRGSSRGDDDDWWWCGCMEGDQNFREGREIRRRVHDLQSVRSVVTTAVDDGAKGDGQAGNERWPPLIVVGRGQAERSAVGGRAGGGRRGQCFGWGGDIEARQGSQTVGHLGSQTRSVAGGRRAGGRGGVRAGPVSQCPGRTASRLRGRGRRAQFLSSQRRHTQHDALAPFCQRTPRRRAYRDVGASKSRDE